MNMSHDHIDFGPQIPFLGSGSLCSFLHLFKISERLMCQMTYLIFKPPSPQLVDSKFVLAKNIQHQVTKNSALLDF
jgi:hypothetical protein